MLRIVSGVAGGIRLTTPPGQDVRPTADRVKESVFASLGDIRGWRVADLYAGSGALGLEALSRGADFVAFVEKNPRHLRILEENLERVRKVLTENDLQTETRLVRADVRHVVQVARDLAGALDLILADPPYATGRGDYGPVELLEDAEFARWAGGALLVVEHADDVVLRWHPATPWTRLRERRFGGTVVSFARQAPGVSPAAEA